MGFRIAAQAFFSDAPIMTKAPQHTRTDSGEAPYPQLKIHRSALAHNLRRFRDMAPRARILLPVKANAYGCGLATLFPFFRDAGVDMLGVANCQEAVELRSLGWQRPVLNLGGFFPQNIATIIEHDISVSLTDLWQIAALDAAAGDAEVQVHIKLDLGMGRIGIRRGDVAEMLNALQNARRLRVAGIFTHFPHAGSDVGAETLRQNDEFLQVAANIMHNLSLSRENVLLHAANSYSAAFFSATHHDMIRPGILFYGYYQSEADREAYQTRFNLRPCLELVATPISYRRLNRGEGISYSSLYHVAAEYEDVAVLPLGYADGIPRALSNRIQFGKFPLRGRVTMDQIVVGADSSEKEIRLLGEGVPSLEYWGELALSFSYEIMSHLGNRLRRVLV